MIYMSLRDALRMASRVHPRAESLFASCSGVKKSGGKVMLNAHVEEIMVEDGKAVGVRLADNSVVRANTVVSNASSWDTLKLLPPSSIPAEYQKSTAEMPINRSFMHLHLGFDATGAVMSWVGALVLPSAYSFDFAARLAKVYALIAGLSLLDISSVKLMLTDARRLARRPHHASHRC